MLKIKITDASDDQIRSFALSLQLDEDGAITNAKGRADLLAVLGPAWDQDYIFAEADEAPVQVQSAVRFAQHVKDFGPEFGPMTTFKIMTTEMPGGKHAAGPTVNGKMCKIDRGVLVSTNYAFYEALKHATGSIVEQAPDKDGKPGELVIIDASNYPMSEQQYPSDEELAEWHRKYGSRELGTLAA